MTLPLTGLRVLDLSRVLSGPYCTMLLADMGAEVIKVEVPGEGDLTRGKGDPESEARGGQPVFFDLNRNKKSLTLNLKAEVGKEVFKHLAETSDVLVENYRPDIMDRLGLGYTVLRQINPRLIYGPAGTFDTRDGYINITAWPDAAFRRLSVALELGELWTDSPFTTPHLCATHRDTLTDILNTTLRLRTTADWIGILHQQHIPCGPILNLQQVFADPQVQHNGMVLEHHHPTAGHRRLLGFPMRLSDAPVDIHLPAPALGEHTEALLTGLGYSPERIEELRRDEVL